MRRISPFLVGFLLATTGLLAQRQAPDKWIGTWGLNASKSTSPAAPKSAITKIEAMPNGIKVTNDNVNAAGTPSHTEYTAKYDGEDVPVTGAAPGATAAVTRIDAYTFEVVTKSQGTMTGNVKPQRDCTGWQDPNSDADAHDRRSGGCRLWYWSMTNNPDRATKVRFCSESILRTGLIATSDDSARCRTREPNVLTFISNVVAMS